ncbi:MAG: hypothetical protein P1U35_13690 [Cycloclasticus sp.]|nr:hypothetical protein [Cycloclasticus sp.]
MKFKFFNALAVTFLASTSAFSLDAKFADESWDGVTVPTGQQCQKFGGINPATPKLIVSEIPAESNALVLEYSDRNYEVMDNGGHGIMKFMIDPQKSQVEVPSVLGHTFDIPKEFTLIEAHRSPSWDKAGAYMPPCSGGKNNEYYVTIKAVKDDKVTASTVLEMGKY